MPPYHLIDPTRMLVELSYTLIVVFICFSIYYKTREIYGLTKYEGIKYFRITFIFFGLAFLFRFISIFVMLMGMTFDIEISRYLFRIFPLVFNGYFSTMAILSLTYSMVWKELQIKHMLIVSNVIAIIISGIAFFSRSSYLLIEAQAVLLIFTVIMALFAYSRSKKISQIFILYVLFFLFWIVNLLALGPRRFIPFEIQTAFQIISIAVIGIIYVKVTRWTK
ncbi:MAG: hypothetical protein CVV36_00455 [Candidatus Methanoperedenaceae archaeon HGW-Methanoperedenaceae-1]|jgi:hypothetical protein|nr:MAG: hypothetical protein CVV36_00455 [Candidatus Methanoperedenaceae archaeon HGW-Methanoperedenaceae-1]